MKYLYLNGHIISLLSCINTRFFYVDPVGGKALALDRSDLYYLARRKYGFAIGRYDPRWVERPSMAALSLARHVGYAVGLPPRRVPRVRMVRAAALKPGMNMPDYTRDGRLRGWRELLSATPSANGYQLLWKYEKHVAMPGAAQIQPQFVFSGDQVFPIFIDWAEKVAL